MKFYYDGELIRTSKTHTYTHAVVAPADPKAENRWVVFGCRSSLAGAEQLLAETRRVWRVWPESGTEARIVPLEVE